MSLFDDELRREFFEEAEEEIELYDSCISCGKECEPIYDEITGRGPYCDECYDYIFEIRLLDTVYPNINFAYPVLDLHSAFSLIPNPKEVHFNPNIEKYNPPINN